MYMRIMKSGAKVLFFTMPFVLLVNLFYFFFCLVNIAAAILDRFCLNYPNSKIQKILSLFLCVGCGVSGEKQTPETPAKEEVVVTVSARSGIPRGKCHVISGIAKIRCETIIVNTIAYSP